MEKEIFKVGDKVFHYGFGWGKIDYIDDEPKDYPIIVVFNPGKEETFTLDGKLLQADINPTLSFTEYSVSNFSQERPIVLPEPGELCLVRRCNTDNWFLDKFQKFEYGYYYCENNKWEQIKRIKILD
jgi:hypothetical protein